ncbi:Nuclear GTPase SLIP-GC [Grifola frondosa]|uniref:Nuclear GTPase SLIP-GC n=1 Tax=Grifola frondosa TaxID=5627 RepID=A0A1C7ML38_GRIFR|nr:Nuclear GTPase SLIP-GC [Grifola frondosa]
MRACTAVVTEIGYHARKTIDADVSFLSEQEWREELSVLLDDLVDEDGHLKRSTDLRSDAGIAWSKVHAVYPSISQEQMVKLTIDQIIARDPKIAKILGTTKHITAPDSKTFAKEIGKYIDSKDQKRGDKKDKSKSKEKNKEPSLMDKLRKEVGKKKKDEDADGPAYWPLIRQVNVRCSSRALSTGAILVDLPGVADANAARNNIAKDYMKKCDCVWILAPITRAVDDKTARDLMGDAFKMQLMMDGNYDANAITFIATKCDDISCSEVIRALNLETEPVLEEIEEQIEKCKEETHEWKGKKSEAEASAKEIDKQLKEAREYLKEYQAHLEALENDEDFKPVLTAKASKVKKSEPSQSKKRKNTRGGKKASPKKRRADHDEDDPMDEDDDMDEDLDFSESESEKNSDEDQDGSDGSQSGSGSEDEDAEMAGSGSEAESEEEEVTIDSLKAKIEDTRNAIKAGRVQLSEHRKQRKEASDMLATLKKKQVKAQREKNAFCSLKRSEFSRDVLKEDFRVGLKDLDDAAQEQQNPDTFDPTVNIRNYDEIDLPVFTCSSRDYVRLKGQVKGDGDPTCFSKIEDTCIPELQEWCHQLTVSSRERAARNFLTHLKTFSNSVRIYVQGIGDVTQSDREAMREKWESSMAEDVPDFMDDGWDSSDPYDDELLAALASYGGGGLFSMNKRQTKVDKYGEPVGVTPRLVKDFIKVIDDCVQELQNRFSDGLEEKCQLGALSVRGAVLQASAKLDTL